MTFGTTTFSKELLFQSTYSLNFLSGNCSFWEQLLLKRIYFKNQIFVKTIYMFSKHHLEPSILESSVSFYFKRGVATGHSFLWPYWLLLEDYLEPSIFWSRVVFYWSSCSHVFFQGLYGTDNFWQQLLIKNNYIFGRPIDIRYF